MVEFSISSSVHASTTHTPFYVNGLLHPRIPALIQSESVLRGRGTCSRKNYFDYRSSRITANADTFDADVDNIDIEEDEFSSSDYAAASSNSDDGAGVYSIANDSAIEEDNMLDEKEKYLRAVRIRAH